MRDPPWLDVAAVFDLLDAAGLTWVGVWPQRDGGPRPVLLQAALFGLFADATDGLTNLATLRGWPVALALADMAGGSALSARAAPGGWRAGQRWGT